MDDVVNLKCGECGHINEVPASWDQPVAFCVKCGHKIPVPRPEAQEQDDQPETGPEEVGFAEQARKSGGKKISVTCGQCGKTVQVSARVAGRKARCKNCDAPMDIPYPDDLEPEKVPRPRNGVSEDGLDLVVPDEEVPPPPGPKSRESMLDLLPEPIQDEVDDEGPHDPLPVVIPLDGQDPAAARRRPPHRPPPGDVPTDAHEPADEDSAEAGELVNAMQDFRSKRQEVLARRRRAAQIRSLVLLGVILVVGAGLAVGAYAFWPTLFPPKDPTIARVEDRGPGDGGAKKAPESPATRTVAATKNGGKAKGVTKSPPTPPQPLRARCDVTGLVTTAFGPGGYYPAAPGSVYWKMTAEIKAADEPIRFMAKGSDARLLIGEKAVDSLGAVAEAPTSPLPRLAVQEVVNVAPRSRRKITLLFEVPEGASEGELAIGELKWPFKVTAQPSAIAPGKLAGTFLESSPRNLRPMLTDPVMSAIQSAGRQRLTVKASGPGLEVEIPEAAVRGKASPSSPGMYGVQLSHAGHELAAKLRFVDGGRTAILYLADKPFHQMTYVVPTPAGRPKPPTRAVEKEPNKTAATPPTPLPTKSKPDRGDGYNKPKNDPHAGKRNPLPTGRSIFD